MNAVGRPVEDKAPDSYGSAPYRWYVLGVLAMVYACHSIDRGIPNILLEPIRHEFHLNDKELGLFSGLGYALSFSLAILPMGFISDRSNRRNFLAVILCAWSLFTALGGFVTNYAQLIAARIGVGAAESGGAPVALPMISDVFPAHRRGSAMGVLYVGNAFGVLVAGVVGGLIAAHFGWRAAFFVAGGPGILLAVLLLTTVKEPRRGASEFGPSAHALQPAPPPRLREVFSFLIAAPGLICLIAGCALLGMVAITLAAWLGSFFIRIHHLNLKQVGLILGLGGSLGGMISPVVFGWLTDRVTSFSARGPLLLVAVGALLSLACGATMLFTSSVPLAIAALMLGDLFRIGYAPPCYSVLMNFTPPPLRGSVMSIMQLTTNVVGFGLGPLIVGALSDLYGGPTALRYAMASALSLLVLAAALLAVSAGLLYGRPRPVRSGLRH